MRGYRRAVLNTKRLRIAAILPMESEYSGRLLEGAMRYARERRGITLLDRFYSMQAPDQWSIRGKPDFDAAMIWASRDAAWVETLLEKRIPVVSVSGDWPVEQVPCVSFDSQAVVRSAVDHLAGLAPASLLHLEFHLSGLPIKENRARMFREESERRGLTASSAAVFGPRSKANSETARRLPLKGAAAGRLRKRLAALPKPLGVWCGEAQLARRVCEMATELGLRIPQDVAVLGLGDFRVAECGSPSLSSLPLPGEVIGFRAFSVLEDILRHGLQPSPFTPVSPPAVIVRESTAGTESTDEVGRARALIIARGVEGITVAEVAAMVGLSPQTLHARYTKRHGCPPGEEIRQVRLASAKRLLGDPSLSISRVSELCGFSQSNRFSNFFRRETGMSPRSWRKGNV